MVEKSKNASKKKLGRAGEEAACTFLERKGYEILERNWKCPAGEADIIVLSPDDALVFVEVKTRSGIDKGLPEESVTPKKRSRYEKIAAYFISDYDGCERHVRFDVIGILVAGKDRAILRHHINAFAVKD